MITHAASRKHYYTVLLDRTPDGDLYFLERVTRLVRIFAPQKLLCCRRPAGGNQLSTGQLKLIFEPSTA